MKQRLVGTLVLGSLALILIPLLLDGEGVERPPLSVTTPPAPIIDTTPLPEPTRPQILADTFDSAADTEMPAPDPDPADDEPPADSSAAPDIADTAPAASASVDTAAVSTTATNTADTATASAAPTAAPTPYAEPPSRSISTPALDAAGLPETWAVRVGVFSNANNARRLEERLKTDAYKAFVRPLGVSSAVYIGPLTTRDEATAIQQQLNAAKSKYQIDGVSVQRYDIGQQ
ncbi:MAG: SPOR domain-containing protein [Gammaproteobacteria bacterium]